MKANKQRFFVLATKSQSEKLTNSERKELENLISSDPDLIEDADFIVDFWSESEFTIEANGDHVFQKISNQINSTREIPMYSSPHSRTVKFLSPSRIAASIILFIITGVIVYFVVQQTVSVNENTTTEVQIKQVEKKVQSGRLRIFLPDGSMVWLNSETKLKYPEQFSDNVRFVELEGEAFFEVLKDPDKPFIVKSGALTTTALGTSFNIRGYSSENNIQITLVSGRVLVESELKNDQKFILDPGYGVEYVKDKGTVNKEKKSIEKIIAWKDGILRFDNDDFQTVIKKLSRWYGVEFVLEGNFKNEKWGYSGWFKNDYLDNVLESISFSQDFEYKIENNRVTLIKK